MHLHPVTSSFITHIGHDPALQELHVKMRSGETYAYYGVSEEAHADLMSATSLGKHYNSHIQGQYEGRKL